MREQTSSPHQERRTAEERRQDSPRSIYDRLDETIRKIDADRRTARRRRNDLPGRGPRRMSIDQVMQFAADVAKAEHPQLDVVGLTEADGSPGLVELLIVIRGCHVEPCRLAIGLDRTMSHAQLREILQRRIRDHLGERPH